MNLSRQVFAKQLRRNMTDAEKKLWYHLRGHRFGGAKFKRQQPLGNYIVDFVCFETKLVIEIDGSQHFENDGDKDRDRWLHSQGFNVLRFWNNEVLDQTESVMERIAQIVAPSLQAISHEERGGKELERLRWRCRRGLLELDIVLGRFVDAHYVSMDEAQKIAFDELLDMPDNTLWDMITGKQTPELESQRNLLELIKTA